MGKLCRRAPGRRPIILWRRLYTHLTRWQQQQAIVAFWAEAVVLMRKPLDEFPSPPMPWQLTSSSRSSSFTNASSSERGTFGPGDEPTACVLVHGTNRMKRVGGRTILYTRHGRERRAVGGKSVIPYLSTETRVFTTLFSHSRPLSQLSVHRFFRNDGPSAVLLPLRQLVRATYSTHNSSLWRNRSERAEIKGHKGTRAVSSLQRTRRYIRLSEYTHVCMWLQR